MRAIGIAWAWTWRAALMVLFFPFAIIKLIKKI